MQEIDYSPDFAEFSAALAADIKNWGIALGFQEVGITDTDLSTEAALLEQWLAAGFHGGMDYMARRIKADGDADSEHKTATQRSVPKAIVPGTIRIITTRLNYDTLAAKDSWAVMDDPSAAFISRYALGRDYHKVVRNKLQLLAEKIAGKVPGLSYRVFADSAPVMEVALATKSGIGWRGKHTLLLNRSAGSLFFLGEIYINLPLPVDSPTNEHCGTCTRCIDICPTKAIVAPYVVDARRCISYLTIENKDAIPVEFREAIGNRIYGCDDCQLTCPWNKFATPTAEKDFAIRHQLDDVTLAELWDWDEATWLQRMEGSAIRRIGFERWRRNLAVAIGNALRSGRLALAEVQSLRQRLAASRASATALVAEHIDWALSTPSTN
ncbi:MAG: tRNA epoxyqueuosine(34) reductase QueG [Burkholderiales bacterium]